MDTSETVTGVASLVTKGDRSLVVHGDRFTKVGEPDDDEPAHDRHEVTGEKTDTIEGTLTVRAKSVAIGQPGEGSDAPDAKIESGAGGEPGLDAMSEIGMRLEADAEVRIESRSAGVELEASGGLSALVSLPMIELSGPDQGVVVWHDARVEVHTEKGVFVTRDGELRLRAMDEADALVVIGPNGVKLSGRTGVVDARQEIRDTSDVTMVGE